MYLKILNQVVISRTTTWLVLLLSILVFNLNFKRTSAQTYQSDGNVIIVSYINATNNNKPAVSTTGQDDGNLEDTNFIINANNDYTGIYRNRINTIELNEQLNQATIEKYFSQSIVLFDVSGNRFTSLPKDLFCPLSNEVKLLNLSHNSLSAFDFLGLISQSGQLCLSELQTLDMSFNELTKLPATGVATLHNLQSLRLDHNRIDSIDELALSSLIKLTYLDLSHNKLHQLPGRVFQKLELIVHLRLNNNQLVQSLSPTLLTGMPSLQVINLSYNNISDISEQTFVDKINLTLVDLTHNHLSTLKKEALRITRLKQTTGFRHRHHHNGEYAGLAPSFRPSPISEFLLSSNPFICDCHLEWLKRINSETNGLHHNHLHVRQPLLQDDDLMLRDQPNTDTDPLEASSQNPNYNPSMIELQNRPKNLVNSESNDQLSPISAALMAASSSVEVANIKATQQLRPHHQMNQAQTSSVMLANQPVVTNQYGRVADLDLIKCTPSFQRHSSVIQQQSHQQQQQQQQSPSSGYHSQHRKIDLVSANSSNFLCKYRTHCFALCQCCEFDACDCEMMCPDNCNCYYDLTWQTNIVDCSAHNYTTIPTRIPMDVTGLYLDGNNITSLTPHTFIGRKNMKSLYLNSSHIHVISNRTFNGLTELQTLHLHHNQLQHLQGYEFESLPQLQRLYLQHNKLTFISNQTFINLRSLEILDISHNRLTSARLDLFWSLGHHNVRLRQLSLSHNWWSCQCELYNDFRRLLKQKLIGQVNIVDRQYLRCYYNSTTMGPMLLADSSSHAHSQQHGSAMNIISQCSQEPTDFDDISDVDFSPPTVSPLNMIQMDSQLTRSSADLPSGDEAKPPGGFDEQVSMPQRPNLMVNPLPFDSYEQKIKIISQPDKEFNHEHRHPFIPVAPSSKVSNYSQLLSTTSLILVPLCLIVLMALVVLIYVHQQQKYHQHHHTKSITSNNVYGMGVGPGGSASMNSTSLDSSSEHHQHHKHSHYSNSTPLWQSAGIKNGVRSLCKLLTRPLGKPANETSSCEKIYDAFISYDKRDEAFVLQQLSPGLEYGQPSYRIADRYRDLPLPTSAYIAEAITSVIGCSHRTIIILTENYLTNDWCRYELQTALHEATIERSHKILAIVQDPKCLLELDGEMRHLLTSNSMSNIHCATGPLLGSEFAHHFQLVTSGGGVTSSGTVNSGSIAPSTCATPTGNQLAISLNNSGQAQTQLVSNKINFLNFNDRKFWPKLQQLMPVPRSSTHTLAVANVNGATTLRSLSPISNGLISTTMAGNTISNSNPISSLMKNTNNISNNNNNNSNKLIINTPNSLMSNSNSTTADQHLQQHNQNQQHQYQHQYEPHPHMNVIHQYNQQQQQQQQQQYHHRQQQQQHNSSNLMSQTSDNAFHHNHSSSISSSTSSPYQQIHSASGLSTATSHVTLNQSGQHFQAMNGGTLFQQQQQQQQLNQPHQNQISQDGSHRVGVNPISVV